MKKREGKEATYVIFRDERSIFRLKILLCLPFLTIVVTLDRYYIARKGFIVQVDRAEENYDWNSS